MTNGQKMMFSSWHSLESRRTSVLNGTGYVLKKMNAISKLKSDVDIGGVA